MYFHPKSILQLNEFELGSSLMPFEKWNMGEDLFGSLDKEHDILDRDLRPFVEQADQMQAIQLMASVDDAWGGFASRYVDRLRDEYGKTALWIWGLEEGPRGTPRVSYLCFLLVGLTGPKVPDQRHNKCRPVPACCILTYIRTSNFSNSPTQHGPYPKSHHKHRCLFQ